MSTLDLPPAMRVAAAPVVVVASSSKVDTLYDRLVTGGESFWTAVYEPFMLRDLTRDDLRALVAKGLHETRGSYTTLLRLFNLNTADYKRFLNVLHKHSCHLRVAPFRSAPVRRPEPSKLSSDVDSVRSA